MDDDGLEILPYGRTREAQERLEAKRAAGKRGGAGCLAIALLVALWLTYQAGWLAGYHG